MCVLQSPQELLLHNFQYIFAHLVCNCTESCRKSSFSFLRVASLTFFSTHSLFFFQDVMKIDLKSIIRSVVNHILNQLLLNLSRHKRRVKAGLTFIIKVIDEKSQDISSDKSLVSHIDCIYSL